MPGLIDDYNLNLSSTNQLGSKIRFLKNEFNYTLTTFYTDWIIDQYILDGNPGNIKI